MSHHRALRLVLVALLMSAWQGALLHPLKHHNASGGFVHVGGSHAPHGSGDKNGANPLCDTLAAVGACIEGSAYFALEPLPDADPLVAGHPAESPSAPALAYRSQAPPSLL